MQANSQMTVYRQELVGKILKVAMREFKARGIRSVKMDELARLLSISKRTLYELYKDKETLLAECVKRNHDEFDEYMAEYARNNGNNVIKIFVEVFRHEANDNRGVSPLFFSELHKYEKIVKLLQEKHESNYDVAQDFFSLGVDQGYFREDINFDLYIRVMSLTMEQVMLQEMYKQYDMVEIYRSVIMAMVRGICTKDGLELLEQEIQASAGVF